MAVKKATVDATMAKVEAAKAAAPAKEEVEKAAAPAKKAAPAKAAAPAKKEEPAKKAAAPFLRFRKDPAEPHGSRPHLLRTLPVQSQVL